MTTNHAATLRTRLAGLAGAGVLLLAAAAWFSAPLIGVTDTYVWKVCATFGAAVAVAIALADGHPFPTLGPANVVTTIRLALLASIAGLIGEPVTPRVAWVALGLAVAFTVLDGVDGWLARRSGVASPFGARYDMETDALFILVLSLLVWRHGKAGAWVLVGGLLRYAFVAARWFLPWMGGALTPTLRGKAAAAGQMAGLAVAVAPVVRWPVSALAVGTTLGVLLWSFAQDVGRLWRSR